MLYSVKLSNPYKSHVTDYMYAKGDRRTEANNYLYVVMSADLR